MLVFQEGTWPKPEKAVKGCPYSSTNKQQRRRLQPIAGRNTASCTCWSRRASKSWRRARPKWSRSWKRKDWFFNMTDNGWLRGDGSFDWVNAIWADSAGVAPCKFDVALLAPAGSPGVLAFPVLISHSDQQHHMVQRCPALTEDSTRISRPIRSVNNHWNRLLHHCGSQFITGLDQSGSADLEGTSLVLAGSSSSGGGIFCGCANG